MREDAQTEVSTAPDRESVKRTGSDLSRRLPVALLLYAVLAALAWFTLGDGSIIVLGRPVELRLVPLIIIGGMALRTVLALKADKIRRSGDALQ